MPARSYLEIYRLKTACSAPRLRLKRRGRWRAHGHGAHPWRGGDGQHCISLDRVIRTLRYTGADMHDKYKELHAAGWR